MGNLIQGNFAAKTFKSEVNPIIELERVISEIKSFAVCYRLMYVVDDFRVMMNIEGTDYTLSRRAFDQFTKDLRDKGLKTWFLSENGYKFVEIRW